jgi:hypothetical protein
MNATIPEPNQDKAEPFLPWTLFDPPESDPKVSGEMRSGGTSSREFLHTLLQALSVWTA